MPANVMFRQQHRTATCFIGANIQTVSANIEATICGRDFHTHYVRDEIELQDWSSGVDNGLRDHFQGGGGERVVYNINWHIGNQPRPFMTNLTTYRTTLANFLDASANGVSNADMIWCAVIENEPDNQNFYDWTSKTIPLTLQDYKNLLSIAVEECHKRNVKVMDGATHVIGYNAVKNGNTDTKSQITRGILEAAASLNVDYINTHWNVPQVFSSQTEMQDGVLKKWADWVHDTYKHPLTSNEWHIEASNGDSDATRASLVASVNTQARKGHFPFCIIFGGDGGSGALEIIDYNTNQANALGIAFGNSVKSGV